MVVPFEWHVPDYEVAEERQWGKVKDCEWCGVYEAAAVVVTAAGRERGVCAWCLKRLRASLKEAAKVVEERANGRGRVTRRRGDDRSSTE